METFPIHFNDTGGPTLVSLVYRNPYLRYRWSNRGVTGTLKPPLNCTGGPSVVSLVCRNPYLMIPVVQAWCHWYAEPPIKPHRWSMPGVTGMPFAELKRSTRRPRGICRRPPAWPDRKNIAEEKSPQLPQRPSRHSPARGYACTEQSGNCPQPSASQGNSC